MGKVTIDLTEDSGDEAPEVREFNSDVKAAIALSKKPQGSKGPSRWDMEKERLARAMKRELESENGGASGNGDASGGWDAGGNWNAVASGSGAVKDDSPAKRARVTTFADLQRTDDAPRLPPPPPPPAARPVFAAQGRHNGVLASPRFFDGAIRQTIKSYGGDNMSFADVLGPMDEMESAIVTSFQTDVAWLQRHFAQRSNIKVLFVGPGVKQSESQQPGVITQYPGTNVHTLLPLPGRGVQGKYMSGGIFHTKLIILVYRSFLRICITSANAIDHDYDKLSNIMHLHDFPRLQYSTPPAHSYRYSKPILDHLTRFGVTAEWSSPIFDGFDFSKSDGPNSPRVVESNQGAYVGWADIKMGGGIDALARAVASCEFEEGGTWEAECATSSVGSYKHDWMARFLGACGGLRPRKYFKDANAIPPSLSRYPETTLPIKVVFPTLDEVNRSFLGQGGGGTIICSKPLFEVAPQYFYKSVNKKARMLQHSKTILAIHKTDSPDVHEAALYLGSHNLSGAAWGVLTHPNKGPKMQINNYELGVVIPIRANSRAELERKMSEVVTYERPLVKYRLGGANGDLAWCARAAEWARNNPK